MSIFHLVWRTEWERLAAGDHYAPPSLQAEGFIHATREPDRLLWVADQFYDRQSADELLVVCLDESKLGSPVKDEDPGVGHRFPHIYGPAALAAVEWIDSLGREPGRWILPRRLADLPGATSS
jgi:uncharacterized protein (DUF952 family)